MLKSVIFIIPLLFMPSEAFRVMTFNVWFGGSQVFDGVQKIVNHIKLVNPDVVALQELKSIKDCYEPIMSELGSSWSGTMKEDGTAVITRHKIVDGSILK
ncbi:hypothetical protein PFISCL1PPCAC_25264, partial [Pristionchus fissidentatus]